MMKCENSCLNSSHCRVGGVSLQNVESFLYFGFLFKFCMFEFFLLSGSDRARPRIHRTT
jgi:hypothetical protein